MPPKKKASGPPSYALAVDKTHAWRFFMSSPPAWAADLYAGAPEAVVNILAMGGLKTMELKNEHLRCREEGERFAIMIAGLNNTDGSKKLACLAGDVEFVCNEFLPWSTWQDACNIQRHKTSAGEFEQIKNKWTKDKGGVTGWVV
eukprot:6076969-Karenia_brevis.AAC.1